MRNLYEREINVVSGGQTDNICSEERTIVSVTGFIAAEMFVCWAAFSIGKRLVHTDVHPKRD